MIDIIQSSDRDRHADTIDQMYRLRARVFKERLQWDVEVRDGRELDRFDACDPLYIVSKDDVTGRLEGAVRLLPTTGPNMLRDVFQVLLPDGLIVESPLIWESSRFAIDPDLANHNGRLNRVTTDLLCGLVEVGLLAGLNFIVSVYDARMARIFRAAKCPAEVIGAPTRIGRVMTYAGLFEISEELRESIADAGRISGAVLSGNTRLPSFAA